MAAATTHPPNQPTNQPTTQPACQPTNQPTRPPTNQPTNRPTRPPTNQPTNQPTDQDANQSEGRVGPSSCLRVHSLARAKDDDHAGGGCRRGCAGLPGAAGGEQPGHTRGQQAGVQHTLAALRSRQGWCRYGGERSGVVQVWGGRGGAGMGGRGGILPCINCQVVRYQLPRFRKFTAWISGINCLGIRYQLPVLARPALYPVTTSPSF